LKFFRCPYSVFPPFLSDARLLLRRDGHPSSTSRTRPYALREAFAVVIVSLLMAAQLFPSCVMGSIRPITCRQPESFAMRFLYVRIGTTSLSYIILANQKRRGERVSKRHTRLTLNGKRWWSSSSSIHQNW
jgi:hypothetical protein